MALLVGYNSAGLDPKVKSVIDEVVAAIQVWAGGIDGINTVERLNELASGVATLPTVQAGTIFAFGGSSAPAGYLLCDGTAVSRATYATLFTAIGTTWGAGNGSSTFNIPDLRRRFPMGKSSSDTLGATGGAFDHTHTVSGSTANESSHTHGAGSYATPTHNHGGATGAGDTEREVQDGAGPPYDQNDIDHVHTISTQAAMSITGTSGTGSAHSHGAGTLAAAANNPPYAVVNYIIKT